MDCLLVRNFLLTENDKDKSRRVEFKVRTNAEQRIERILAQR